jgi:long-chain acyl-CoA synthetase
MTVDDLVERWRTWPDAEAVIWQDRVVHYAELEADIDRQRRALRDRGLVPGATVALEADFSPTAIAVLFALWLERAIVLPLLPEVAARDERAGAPRFGEWQVRVADESVQVFRRIDETRSDLLDCLRAEGAPGLLVRTSGSEGTPKTIVHDVRRWLRLYEPRPGGHRTLAFFIFDHIGGLHTILTALSRGGCLVVPRSRTPDHVAEAIARHRVEVLPASPTFLNLLALSGAHERHDFGSLQVVTYGTEVMADSTLQRAGAAWPHVRFVQNYGLSETSVLRTRTRESDVRWLEIRGEGTEWRVIDGLLEVRSDTAMLGYLDAPSPFTADGWLKTGDVVEVDGEFVRVLGRQSDMLNVGGRKVYPAEIETVLLSAPGVLEATVCGEANPLIGTMITAVVRVAGDEPNDAERARLRQFAQQRLLAYQVPQRLVVTREPLHTERFKARRRADA